MATDRIASLVLAAGAARRFGSSKQLAPLFGRPLLEHALAAAAAGPGEEILLVLGANAEAIECGVDLGDVRVLRCPNWEHGQGASLSAGLAALGSEVEAALITLGDEPGISPAASRRLVAGRRSGRAALRATYGGRPGHPVLIERSLFRWLISSAPTAKPAQLLREAGIEGIECGDLGEPFDIDTPEQLLTCEALFAEGLRNK